MHFAAFFGRPVVIRLLLGRGADVEARDEALVFAVQAGHTATVRELLKGGADPTAHSQLALHIAEREGHFEIYEMLKHAIKGRSR